MGRWRVHGPNVPFASVAALHAAMLDVWSAGRPEERQLAFLCGHLELAGREAQSYRHDDGRVHRRAEQRGPPTRMTGASRNELQA